MQPLEAASGTWMFVCEAFFSTENNLQLGYGVIYWFLSLQLLGSEERRSASVCPAAERSQGWGQTCQTSYCVQPDSAGVQTSPLHPGLVHVALWSISFSGYRILTFFYTILDEMSCFLHILFMVSTHEKQLTAVVFPSTDIECGGGFYVRSLVDDLGKGEMNSVSSST